MEILKFLRRVFYPRHLTCSICKREKFNDSSICDDCRIELPFNDKSICGHCGRTTAYPSEYCDYCKNRESFADFSRSAFNYDGAVKNLISRFKYSGEKYLSEFFTEELKPVFLKHIGYADAVVYVPSTKKKIRQRGYNQGEVLAREFARFAEIPVVDALEKIKDTESQVGLTQKERRKNLKGCFKVTNKDLVKGKRVLLIDDVLTTGSTAEIIAEKLKKAGAKEVVVLTVASVSFKNPKGSDGEDMQRKG